MPLSVLSDGGLMHNPSIGNSMQSDGVVPKKPNCREAELQAFRASKQNCRHGGMGLPRLLHGGA